MSAETILGAAGLYLIAHNGHQSPCALKSASATLRQIVELPGPKYVLVLLQVYFLSTEVDAFHAEAQTLLCAGFQRQLDLATGPHDTLPGQTIRRIRSQ